MGGMGAMLKCRKGSLTLEAALILPFFMATVLFISFFIKAHLVQDLVQDALTEAVMEVCALSYPYGLSGALSYREDTDQAVRDRIQLMESHFDQAVSSLTALENAGEGGGPLVPPEVAGQLSPEEIFRLAKRAAVSQGLRAAEEEVVRRLILTSMAASLSGEGGGLLNRVSALGIEGGLEGLDFSDSLYYSNGEVLDVRVTYRLDRLDPFGLIRGVTLENRAVCRAWLSGVDIDADGRISPLSQTTADTGSEEEPEEAQEERETRTCYIIRDSSASARYHLADCPNLRVRGSPDSYKAVVPVQVVFVSQGDAWQPEAAVTWGGRAYDFCGNCQKGYIRMKD